MRSTIALGLRRSDERLDYNRLEPSHAGGVQFGHKDVLEAVDDEAGKPVRLGMHQAIKRLREELAAEPQGSFQPAGDKALVDRPPGVTVE